MTTWTARPIPPDSTDGVRTYWVDDENGTPICDVHELNGKGKEHAELIAAAPALLNALANATSLLQAIWAESIIPPAVLRNMIDEARGIIIKAEEK
jgi:hypothetical protein